LRLGSEQSLHAALKEDDDHSRKKAAKKGITSCRRCLPNTATVSTGPHGSNIRLLVFLSSLFLALSTKVTELAVDAVPTSWRLEHEGAWPALASVVAHRTHRRQLLAAKCHKPGGRTVSNADRLGHRDAAFGIGGALLLDNWRATASRCRRLLA
jgi:hypothetical protein